MTEVTTFAEYHDLVHKTFIATNWRLGQTYFNVLDTHRPDLARKVRGSYGLDPYYHDSQILAFLEFVEANW